MTFNLRDAFGWLLIVWGVVAALVILWGVWVTVGPSIQRRWPRLVPFVSRLLPLPRRHADRFGADLTFHKHETTWQGVKALKPGQQPTVVEFKRGKR